jgi:pimeloyl-ACP methyl ester carboxylesterase
LNVSFDLTKHLPIEEMRNMKVAAAVYTLASVVVLALMVMRPAVNIAPTAQEAANIPAPEAAASEAMPPVTMPTVAPTADTALPGAPPAPTVAPVPMTEPAPAVVAPPVMPPPPIAVPMPAVPPTPVPTPFEPNLLEEKKNDVAPPAANKPSPDANASPDYAREQRLASEISDTIMDGKVISLNDGTHNFMGILTSAEQPRGAVIILHGRGYHPDWEDVVHPLRVGLVAKGWTTLALQMPVLEKEAKYYDYVPLFANADKRINAGIALLKQQGITKIVLAAHSCGAHMAMNWVDTTGGSDLAAYVGLGMGATDYQQELLHPFPLDKLSVPILDVYGEKDFPQVLSLAPERQALIQKAGNTHSKQMVLPDADHDYKDKGDALTAVVANWLNSLP